MFNVFFVWFLKYVLDLNILIDQMLIFKIKSLMAVFSGLQEIKLGTVTVIMSVWTVF